MTATQVFVTPSYTAFIDGRQVAKGDKSSVHQTLRQEDLSQALIFEDWTGKQVDFDLTRDYQEEVAYSGPGRPKLGVKPREVTLLPRHWEWLDSQSGGASARLRGLVDAAMKEMPPRERIRQAQDVTARMLSALAGNLPNYEEASRALYRKDSKAFFGEMSEWPKDIQAYALQLSQDVFLDS